ncbi:GntR family transcriptional regulator [Solicola gregarius]|uniref:GntR family transcriptional regulator n=1 Tax=Solicola gregarius TaxID=2908642 RepID=A0AA46TLH5_9ACTN|nr:GntR family transcriptional regulator [Solicola gregarius]UYM07280.1 GntR family transcriptional regulator [Solicola gregarius]
MSARHPYAKRCADFESEGLVVNDPHRGATVSESRSGVVEDNAQIRAALEPLGARLAAKAITEDQLATLRGLNDEMIGVAEGDPRYGVLNREFHFTIYQAAGSPMLLSMMRLLWQAMPDGPQVTRSHAASAEQHAALIVALAAGDADGAADITRTHIVGTDHLESEISH